MTMTSGQRTLTKGRIAGGQPSVYIALPNFIPHSQAVAEI